MSLRRSLSTGIRATHPALFAVGFAVVAVQTALYFGFAALESVIPTIYATILTFVGPFVVLALTGPLAVALYVPVRERTETASGTLRVAVRAVGRHYLRVLAAHIAAFVAAVGLALGTLAVVFCLHTAVQSGRYALGTPAPPNVWVTTWLFPYLFVVFVVCGVLVTRFADVFAAFGDTPPRSAWRASLAFVRREPKSFLGYASVVAVLLGTGQILPFAFDSTDEPLAVVAALGLVVLVGTVGLVFASAFHAAFFDRSVEATVGSVPPGSTSWNRVAVVAVVLLAAVAGAGYVRAADIGVSQGEVQDLPEDPEAAYPVAAKNTAHANHRYVLERRNESDPDATFRTIERAGVDFDDRQLYLYIHGEDIVLGGYYDEGTLAIRNGGSPGPGSSLDALSRHSENWTVMSVPGYGLVASSEFGEFRYADVDWSIESENESTIVYRVDEQDQVLDAFGSTAYAGSAEPLAADSYVEVYVDRDASVVSGARFRLHSRETGHDFTYVARYQEVGSADLERPAAIGSRGLIEWIWDVTYY